MPVVRPSLASGAAAIPARCAGALSTWEDLEEPADIEESVQEFIPKDEPLRSETINTLAKVRALACSPPAALHRTACTPHLALSRSVSLARSAALPQALSRSALQAASS